MLKGHLARVTGPLFIHESVVAWGDPLFSVILKGDQKDDLHFSFFGE